MYYFLLVAMIAILSLLFWINSRQNDPNLEDKKLLSQVKKTVKLVDSQMLNIYFECYKNILASSNIQLIRKRLSQELTRCAITSKAIKDAKHSKVDITMLDNIEYIYQLIGAAKENFFDEVMQLLQSNNIIIDEFGYNVQRARDFVDFVDLFLDYGKQFENYKQWNTFEQVKLCNRRYKSIVYCNGNGYSDVLRRRQTFGNGGFYFLIQVAKKVVNVYSLAQTCNNLCRWTNRQEIDTVIYSFVATDIDADCRRLTIVNGEKVNKVEFEIVLELDDIVASCKQLKNSSPSDNTTSIAVKIKDNYATIVVQHFVNFSIEQNVILCKGCVVLLPYQTTTIDCAVVVGNNPAMLQTLSSKFDTQYFDKQIKYNLELLDCKLFCSKNLYKQIDNDAKMTYEFDNCKNIQFVCGDQRLFGYFVDNYKLFTKHNGKPISNFFGYNYFPERINVVSGDKTLSNFSQSSAFLDSGAVYYFCQTAQSKSVLKVCVVGANKVYALELQPTNQMFGQTASIEFNFDLYYNYCTIPHKYSIKKYGQQLYVFKNNQKLLKVVCSEQFDVLPLAKTPSIRLIVKKILRQKTIVYFGIGFEDSAITGQSLDLLFEQAFVKSKMYNKIFLRSSDKGIDHFVCNIPYALNSCILAGANESNLDTLQLLKDCFCIAAIGSQNIVPLLSLASMQYKNGQFASSIQIDNVARQDSGIFGMLFVLVVVEFVKINGTQILERQVPYFDNIEKASGVSTNTKTFVKKNYQSLLNHCLNALACALRLDNFRLIKRPSYNTFFKDSLDEWIFENLLFIYTVREFLPFVGDRYNKSKLDYLAQELAERIVANFCNRAWLMDSQNIVVQCIAFLCNMGGNLNLTNQPENSLEQAILAYTLMQIGHTERAYKLITKLTECNSSQLAKSILYKCIVQYLVGVQIDGNQIKIVPNPPTSMDKLLVSCKIKDLEFDINIVNKFGSKWKLTIGKMGYNLDTIALDKWLKNKTITMQKVD